MLDRFPKRDDYTGPRFGGNKVRKLEYVLAQLDGADTVLTMGGIRSNHARHRRTRLTPRT